MWYMSGWHKFTGKPTVLCLIVEKHIRTECLQKLRFTHTAKKQRLIDTDIPGSQRLNDPLMRRRSPGCNKRGSYRTLPARELALQIVERGQKGFEGPSHEWLVSGLLLVGCKCVEA